MAPPTRVAHPLVRRNFGHLYATEKTEILTIGDPGSHVRFLSRCTSCEVLRVADLPRPTVECLEKQKVLHLRPQT